LALDTTPYTVPGPLRILALAVGAVPLQEAGTTVAFAPTLLTISEPEPLTILGSPEPDHADAYTTLALPRHNTSTPNTLNSLEVFINCPPLIKPAHQTTKSKKPNAQPAVSKSPIGASAPIAYRSLTQAVSAKN